MSCIGCVPINLHSAEQITYANDTNAISQIPNYPHYTMEYLEGISSAICDILTHTDQRTEAAQTCLGVIYLECGIESMQSSDSDSHSPSLSFSLFAESVADTNC